MNKIEEKRTVKQLIQNAYLKMLSTTLYNDISVSELVRTAGVARASFYRNFSNTSDVLNSIIEDFTTNIIEEVVPLLMADQEKAWRELTVNLLNQVKKDKFLKFAPLPDNIEYLTSSIQKKFAYLPHFESLTLSEKYIPVVNMTILFSCMKLWINTGFKESVEELSEFIISMMIKDVDISSYKHIS